MQSFRGPQRCTGWGLTLRRRGMGPLAHHRKTASRCFRGIFANGGMKGHFGRSMDGPPTIAVPGPGAQHEEQPAWCSSNIQKVPETWLTRNGSQRLQSIQSMQEYQRLSLLDTATSLHACTCRATTWKVFSLFEHFGVGTSTSKALHELHVLQLLEGL